MEALLCTACGQILFRVDDLDRFKEDLLTFPDTYRS
jgi:hypothetical protein